ncbi:MAG: ABC transporter ATP-binding protein [Candidatus Heimdallarchaeota archaeon]
MSLQVQDLKIYYRMRRGDVKAVESVSFTIEKGDSIGLVGESGCGKSTIAYGILRMLPYPGQIVGGQIYFNDIELTTMTEEELQTIRWNRISIVFQGAMNALNPIVRIKDQITEAIMQHDKKVSEKEALDRAKDLFKLVGMDPGRVHHYPFEFSGGMKQRAMMVMALACNPEFIIADEPTTALDVTVQAQIMELLKKFVDQFDITLMLITHDLSVVAETCKKVIIMYAGRIAEMGSVVTLFDSPRHPYSQGLIASIPSMEKASNQTLASIPGSPPNLLDPPMGCRFHPRCEYAQDICRKEVPPLESVGGDHFVACFLTSGRIKDPSYSVKGAT